MLLAMKWLLLTVLSVQLMIAPPCLAAIDCDMGSSHSEASPEVHNHSSAAVDTSQHAMCDDCDEASGDKALADDATSAILCSSTSVLAIIAVENACKSIDVIATTSTFAHAPPDTRAPYPLPKVTAVHGETLYLRTLRIRL